MLWPTQLNGTIETMKMSDQNWIWPEKDDRIVCSVSDILKVIDPPMLINNRGVSLVPEFQKYRKCNGLLFKL